MMSDYDDYGTVLETVRDRSRALKVQVIGHTPQEFRYWDESKHTVPTDALTYAQEQGFEIVSAGASEHLESGERHATFVARRDEQPSIEGFDDE
jgi:hypothetical protein